jgi:hydrogenase nickel incorporation protein HypA/HybF
MHEMSIAQNIIEIIEEQLRGVKFTKVSVVKMKVGALTAVEPSALSFCFDVISRGTVAEGAGLEIDHVPIRGRCDGCQSNFEVEEYFFLCPKCGNTNVKLTSGEELLVSELEIE